MVPPLKTGSGSPYVSSTKSCRTALKHPFSPKHNYSWCKNGHSGHGSVAADAFH